MQDVLKVFGAPGCGKTTRLMGILDEELKRVAPNEIAFVSFTRKGTYEGQQRAMARFGFKEDDLPFFRTLHSIAFRDGGHTKYEMIGKKHYREFSEAMNMKFTGYYTEDFYNNDDRYIFVHFLKRNNQRMAETYIQDLDQPTLMNIEHNFRRYKEQKKILDFTDIIENFIARQNPLPVKVAIIDEAQDLTTLQWLMCRVAFRDCERVYVAGDDDQAIYEWSGADVGAFLNLEGRQEVLGKSYRLQKKILEAARRVSAMIERRVEKDFEPVGDEGEVFVYNTLEEIHVDTSQSWYFLSRNNWFLQDYDKWLKKQARVFEHKDALSYEPRHIDAINAYTRAQKAGKLSDLDEVKLKLYCDHRPDVSRPWFEQLNFDAEQSTYYRDLIRYKTDLRSRTLHVDTIHGVKGGEADNVVLTLDFTKAVRINMDRNPDSELRCLYVAMTRAKKHLHLVHSASRNGYDNYLRVTE